MHNILYEMNHHWDLMQHLIIKNNILTSKCLSKHPKRDKD
jgi:hypothetical protein